MSIFLLALSMCTLSLGMAYTAWTGTDAVGLVLLGIAYFQETASSWYLFSAPLSDGLYSMLICVEN